MIKSSKFYVYIWLRDDGTPYYVGKGCGRRAFVTNSHLVNRPSINRILLREFPTEESAREAEMFFIAHFGRKDIGTGILRNMTDGGDRGPVGYKHTEEWKIKMSERSKGNKYRLGHPCPMKGKKHTQETREKMSVACKGRAGYWTGKKRGQVHSEESRRKIGFAARNASPETRRKKSEALKGKPWTPARRAAQILLRSANGWTSSQRIN